ARSPGSPTGTGASSAKRAASPNRPGWRVVWFAPTPRSSGGRSAVRRMSGTPEWCASSAAGRRFATAVPDVQTTAAGTRLSRPMPSAVNPACRSSMRTCSRIRPRRSISAAASARACDLDPGLTTTWRTPSDASASRRAQAASVAGEAALGALIARVVRLVGAVVLLRGGAVVGLALVVRALVVFALSVVLLRRRPAEGLLSIEQRELLLEAADALVGRRQELRIVVGRRGALRRCGLRLAGPGAADRPPEDAADDGHERDDHPHALGRAAMARLGLHRAVDDAQHPERDRDQEQGDQESCHDSSL